MTKKEFIKKWFDIACSVQTEKEYARDLELVIYLEVESILAIPDEALQEPVAFIEHHKAGDNLIWGAQKSMQKVTPLYKSHPPLKIPTEFEIEMASSNPKKC